MTPRFSLAAALCLLGCGDKSTDTDTGGEAPTSEQCLAESQQSGCEALGCRWRETLLVPDETHCATAPGPGRCFALAGQPVGQASEPHAYYRIEGQQIEYMIHAHDCTEPLGWHECGDEADAPVGCACLCGTRVDGDPVRCGTSPLCDG